MSKLLALVRRAPKRTSAAFLMIAAAVIIPAALFAWGPDRPTYTMEVPADHVTFNSITNNPDVGDERNFIRIKEDSTTSTYVDNVTLEPGKVYQVMAYYHNNATSNLNDSGVGIANNTTLKMEIPGVVKAGVKAAFTGTVSASNANPTSVYDEAYGTNATNADIALRYVSGSAVVTSNGAVNGAKLPDSLFTTGAYLGYDSLNGVLPACSEYAGYVVFKIRVDQPNFTLKKQVSIDDGKTWVDDSAKAEAGSTIQYRIVYQNTGTSQQDNVSLRDILPSGVTYVDGSSQIANSTTDGKYKATVDGITTTGYNAGSYQPQGNVYFKFSAKVASNDNLPDCGENTLINTAKATTSGGAKEDTANIVVPKTCKTEATYTCNTLSVSKTSDTASHFTTDYTVQNATFKDVTYVIRDADGKVIDTKTSTANTLDYDPGVAGKYNVQATINVTADDKSVSATSEGCKALFDTTTETPSELPKTGTGETFAAVMGLGALITSGGYYIASRRTSIKK